MTYIYCFYQNKTTGKCKNIGIATRWLCKHFLHGLLIQRSSSMPPWISISRPSFTSRNTSLILLNLPHFLVFSCSYSRLTNILAKICNSNNQTYYTCWAKDKLDHLWIKPIYLELEWENNTIDIHNSCKLDIYLTSSKKYHCSQQFYCHFFQLQHIFFASPVPLFWHILKRKS